ncbi:MAG TPA: hypothetical protein D7H95_06470 [Candidatus Poseidoniales archaeon]|nr:MAG TPA: hypothetical protein D7H95_06470 [Candidatus Poseidoniales archaeon]
MQALPPPPGPTVQTPPVVAPTPAPVSPYQPAKGFDKASLSYSFERWLMMGIVLILAAALFSEVVAMWGPPDEPDVDATLEDLSQYLEDLDGYNDLDRVVTSIGTILQTVGLGLIGYALLREAHSSKHEHTALRVTSMILGVLVVTNLAARSLNLV